MRSWIEKLQKEILLFFFAYLSSTITHTLQYDIGTIIIFINGCHRGVSRTLVVGGGSGAQP